jgi:hypothetical protein
MIALVFVAIGALALYGVVWLCRNVPRTRDPEAWLAWTLCLIVTSAVAACVVYAFYWAATCPGIVDCTG